MKLIVYIVHNSLHAKSEKPLENKKLWIFTLSCWQGGLNKLKMSCKEVIFEIISQNRAVKLSHLAKFVRKTKFN